MALPGPIGARQEKNQKNNEKYELANKMVSPFNI